METVIVRGSGGRDEQEEHRGLLGKGNYSDGCQNP